MKSETRIEENPDTQSTKTIEEHIIDDIRIQKVHIITPVVEYREVRLSTTDFTSREYAHFGYKVHERLNALVQLILNLLKRRHTQHEYDEKILTLLHEIEQ